MNTTVVVCVCDLSGNVYFQAPAATQQVHTVHKTELAKECPQVCPFDIHNVASLY